MSDLHTNWDTIPGALTPRCEVCQDPSKDIVGVAAVPGVPISCAYCADCFRAGAHPWWVLVSNTAAVGGLQHADQWWVATVEDTCTYLGRTRAQFDADVAELLALED